MKVQHTTLLALIGWYLKRPPLPHLNVHATNKSIMLRHRVTADRGNEAVDALCAD
jgi:hypothetical protein